MRYIKVNNQTNIIDIYTASHDIGCYKDVYFPVLEVFHDFFPLRLFQVRVHLCYVKVHPTQCIRQFFHLNFSRSKNDYSLWASFAEQIFENFDLLGIITDISCLHDCFRRTGNSQLNFFRVL